MRFYPEIAERLLELSPKTTFVIAGKPADDIDRSIFDRLEAMPNVELHARFIEEGEVDDFFEGCDLVIMPYTSITQSGVILDAYSRSRCVVAFDIEGIDQFVFNGKTLVSPFNVTELVQVVSDLLEDIDGLNHITRRAWEMGRDAFSPERASDVLLSIYEELMR